MATETFGGNAQSVPGTSSLNETVERNVEWPAVPTSGQRYRSVKISGSAVDAGNTRTSFLRPGLVMALSGGVALEYNPAVAAQNEAYGPLVEECDLLDPISGTAKVKQTRVLVGGGARANMCIGLDPLARHQMGRRIIFDDAVQNGEFPYRRSVAKTTNYTVLDTDNGTLFHTTGASGGVTFTLPAVGPGLGFIFWNTVDQTMTVASAEGDNVVVDADVTADSVAASTSSHKIAAMYHFFTVYDGSAWKWAVANWSQDPAILPVEAT